MINNKDTHQIDKKFLKTLGCSILALQLFKFRDIARRKREVLMRNGKLGKRPSPALDILKWEGTQDDTIVVFDNGLGLSYECWDWMIQRVPDEFTVLVSNRRGIGGASRRQSCSEMEEVLSREVKAYSNRIFIAHSIGALVLADRLKHYPHLWSENTEVWLIDPTDSELLKTSSRNKTARQRVNHVLWNSLLTAWSGTNQIDSKLGNEVNFRVSVEKKYLANLRDAKSARSVIEEYRYFKNSGLETRSLADHVRAVFSSERHSQNGKKHAERQKNLAQELAARFQVVEKSSHFSIIGEQTSSDQVSNTIWSDYV